jgi:hypothetical protein
MKTEDQIKQKIKEHEDHIDKLIKDGITNDHDVDAIKLYLLARKALLWALSEDEFIGVDHYEMSADYECCCYESTKIF